MVQFQNYYNQLQAVNTLKLYNGWNLKQIKKVIKVDELDKLRNIYVFVRI